MTWSNSGDSGGTSSRAAGSVEFVEVGESADVSEGGRMLVEVDGLPIMILRIAGQLYAIADRCSHEEEPLSEGDLRDYEIVCPRHGARFDVRNGKVTALPAVKDIPIYVVREEDGKIEIGLPMTE